MESVIAAFFGLGSDSNVCSDGMVKVMVHVSFTLLCSTGAVMAIFLFVDI